MNATCRGALTLVLAGPLLLAGVEAADAHSVMTQGSRQHHLSAVEVDKPGDARIEKLVADVKFLTGELRIAAMAELLAALAERQTLADQRMTAMHRAMMAMHEGMMQKMRHPAMAPPTEQAMPEMDAEDMDPEKMCAPDAR